MILPKTINVIKIREDAEIPSKAYSTDSGFDITILSIFKEMGPNVKLYGTGLKFEPEKDIYLELFARSSLMKQGYMLANNVGIIDNHYRGELLVALYKFDPSLPDLKLPCKVAQIIPRQIVNVVMNEVIEISKTERGEGGFGSTSESNIIRHINNDKYTFYKGLDFPGYDIKYVGNNLSLENLALLAKKENVCEGFNTLGFLKYFIDINKLTPSKYYNKETDGLYVDTRKYTNLYFLAEKYRLDKIITYGHNYIPTYNKFFNTRKNSTKKILEIGIGCIEEGQMIHMLNHKYVTGNSLRMWRDYFPNAKICGIDIFEKAMISEERIMTMVADQSDSEALLKVIDNFGSDIDIIIDDGSHQIAHQVFTFMFLEKYLNNHGIYVIEDISSQHISAFSDLSIFPENFRSYLKKNYNFSCIDTRGAHNNYNDIMCVFEKKYPIVYINGISGLANNIFQIFSAIPYAEEYNAKIILNNTSEILHYGTSDKFGRNVSRTINGVKQSYLNTIFNKFDTTYDISDKTHVVDNDCFTKNKLELNNPDMKLLITGYCQNIELFYKHSDRLFDYLNLSDETIINYVNYKYPMDSSIKNIMLGIRIGNDFKHMKKLTKNSYTNALKKLIKSDDKYHIYILADVSKDWVNFIDEEYLSNTTFIDEDDIVQIYLGLRCNNFICSESTYHYIISLLAFLKDKSKKVFIFDDTDITNRCLSHILKEWISVKY